MSSGQCGMNEANARPEAERRSQSVGGGYWYRLDLQYDGTAFRGWARQPDVPTVQGALETALGTVLGEVPVLRVAGRTDSGAHARRQVVSVELDRHLDCAALVRSLNALTPPRCAYLPALRCRSSSMPAQMPVLALTGIS